MSNRVTIMTKYNILFLIAVLTTLQASLVEGNLRGNQQIDEDRTSRALSLQSFGSNPTYPLGKCEGDCDNDGQCRGNLVCFQRNSFEAVPGCMGGTVDSSRTDYCVNPDDINRPPNPAPVPAPIPAPVPAPVPVPVPPPIPGPVPVPVPVPLGPSGGIPLQSFGGSPPRNRFPLGECQGDCDSNSDCGPGLRCFMRSNFDPTPGCIGIDPSRTDYCVRINQNDPAPGPVPVPVPPPVPAPPTPPTPPAPASLTNFRLKLYWEEGYFWQEETIERLWCMECRNNGCDYGNKIYIKTCSNRNQRFDFVQVGEYTMIQLHGTNLCFERDFKDIFMLTCDESNDRQLWFAQRGDFDERRVEISPKTLRDHCITQRHHPKADEEVELEPCEQARRGETSYWNRF